MQKVILITLACLLAACGPGKFAVRQANDEFSGTDNRLYISENNRISSKSIAGGRYLDEHGIYFDPFVEKNADGAIISIGMHIINKTSFDTMMGGVNQLGVLESVACLADGELIRAEVMGQETQSDDVPFHNSLFGYSSIEQWETGLIALSEEELKKLAHTKNLECKITGTKRSVTYRQKDISKTFIPNLKSFYDTYVRNSL